MGAKIQKPAGNQNSGTCTPVKKGKERYFSAPQDVLELLEEYIELREADILPDRIRKAIPAKMTYLEL